MQIFKNNRGFTLIELLIVIAIIGLLASIVLVGLNQFRSRARDARRAADLRSTQTQLEGYFAENGGIYPGGAGPVDSNLQALAGLESVPNDPLCPGGACTGGQVNYEYESPNNQEYILRAWLENQSEVLNNDYEPPTPITAADGTAYGTITDCTDGNPPAPPIRYWYCVSL